MTRTAGDSDLDVVEEDPGELVQVVLHLHLHLSLSLSLSGRAALATA